MFRKMTTALAALAVCTQDGPDENDSPDLFAVPQTLTEAAAVLAALEHVAALPENRAPVQQGSRTFETNGAVIVYHDRDRQTQRESSGGWTSYAPTTLSFYADIEAGARRLDWTTVLEDPRQCTDSTPESLPFLGVGGPTCVLGGDPDELLLEWRRGSEIARGYEVLVTAHRNRTVPFDRHVHAEVSQAMTIGEYTVRSLDGGVKTIKPDVAVGRFSDVAADGRRASVAVVDETTYWNEYNRRATAAAGPGVLGWVRYVVRVDLDGTVSHTALLTSVPGIQHVAPLARSPSH